MRTVRTPHSPVRVLAAGVTALLLVLSYLLIGTPARAESVTVATIDELRQAVTDAGSEPVTIAVEGTIQGSVTIPAGADITLIGDGTSVLKQPASTSFGPSVLTVTAGGSLTLGAGLAVEGTAPGNVSHPLVMVNGTFEMQDGSAVRGAVDLLTETAAVKVSGADAHAVLAGGEISGNTIAVASGKSAGRAAGGLWVGNGASADLTGTAIIDNGLPSGTRTNYTAGGVWVQTGGQINLDGSLISGNTGGLGGGIVLYGYDTLNETTPPPQVSFTFTSGQISDNQAGFAGAGLSVAGNAVARMSGGSISGNTTPGAGAGVNTWDFCFQHSAVGMSIPLSCPSAEAYPEWKEQFPASFHMTGGEITDNHATSTGGGINIASGGVVLEGGLISGNTSLRQGGGVYVTTMPYEVSISNALVTGNHANATGETNGIGGGIWSCPTGEVHFHVNDGVAITGNTADTAGNDFVFEDYANLTPGRYPGSADFGERALGGGAIDWWRDGVVNGMTQDPAPARFADTLAPEMLPSYVEEPDTGHSTLAPEGAFPLAEGLASLVITNNQAPRGAGIGTNGGVVFGTEGETFELAVSKTWLRDGVVVDGADDALPESVTVDLFRLEGGQEYLVDTAELTGDGGWTATFAALPRYTSSGAEIAWEVRERPVEGVTSEVTREGDDVTVTNTLPNTPEPDPDPTPTVETDEPPTPDPTVPEPSVPEPSAPETPAASPSTPSRPMPPTGADPSGLAIAALGLTVLGGGLLAARTRRA